MAIRGLTIQSNISDVKCFGHYNLTPCVNSCKMPQKYCYPHFKEPQLKRYRRSIELNSFFVFTVMVVGLLQVTQVHARSFQLRFANGSLAQFFPGDARRSASLKYQKPGSDPQVLKTGFSLWGFKWHQVLEESPSRSVEPALGPVLGSFRIPIIKTPTFTSFFLDGKRHYIFEDGTAGLGCEDESPMGGNDRGRPLNAVLVEDQGEKFIIESFGAVPSQGKKSLTMATRVSDGQCGFVDNQYHPDFADPSSQPRIEGGFLALGESAEKFELQSLRLSYSFEFEGENYRISHKDGRTHPKPEDGIYITRLRDGKLLRVGFPVGAEEFDYDYDDLLASFKNEGDGGSDNDSDFRAGRSDDDSDSDASDESSSGSSGGFGSRPSKKNVGHKRNAKLKTSSRSRSRFGNKKLKLDTSESSVAENSLGESETAEEPIQTPEKRNPPFRIEKGILFLADTDGMTTFGKKVDLRKFDAECDLFANLGDPRFTESSGETTNGLERMQVFLDLVEDARQNPQNYKETSDSTIMDLLETAIFGRSSSVLIGAPGTGKSSAVRAFAREVAEGKRKNIPRTFQIFAVSPMALIGGNGVIGPTERLVQSMIVVGEKWKAAFFLDEMHAFSGAGTHSNNPTDILQSFKGPTALGKMILIGTDTLTEFNRTFAMDRPFYQRFEQIAVNPPPLEALKKLVKSWFFPQSPDIASEKLEHEKETRESEALIDFAIRYSDQHSVASAQPRAVSTLMNKFQTRWKMLRDSPQQKSRAEILKDVAEQSYRLQDIHFDRTKSLARLEALKRELDQKVVGQANAKTAVIAFWRKYFSGVTSEHQKVNAMVLVGPSGVGKTLLAQASANAVGIPFTKIQMNEFSDFSKFDLFKLRLYQSFLEDSHRLFILDSFDAASPEVQVAFKAMIQDGKFEANLGAKDGKLNIEVINATNALFILSTSAAAKEITQNYERGLKENVRIAPENLIRFIRPYISEEVLNSVGWIVPMTLPTREEYIQAAKTQIRALLDRESKRVSDESRILVSFAFPALENYLQKVGFVGDDTQFWMIQKRILNLIEDSIARRILAGQIEDGVIVELEVNCKSDGNGQKGCLGIM